MDANRQPSSGAGGRTAPGKEPSGALEGAGDRPGRLGRPAPCSGMPTLGAGQVDVDPVLDDRDRRVVPPLVGFRELVEEPLFDSHEVDLFETLDRPRALEEA